MKLKLIAIVTASLFTVGCAGTAQNYYKAVDDANLRQAEIEYARSQTEMARIQALMEMAKSGDETSRVAATMALAFSQNNQSQSNVIVPQQAQDRALEWTRVLIGPMTTLGLAGFNYNLTSKQIDANRDVTLGSFDAMTELGTRDPVQTPAPLIIQDGVVVGTNGGGEE